MSIHIKGKLPTGRCEAQFFANGCVAFYDVEGKYLGESKWEELPPHGRLIDADALGDFPFNIDFCDNGDIDEWIAKAPTIIPPEGGADG